MTKINFKYYAAVATVCCMGLVGCSEFTPEGYDPAPELPTVSNLTATPKGPKVIVSWDLPNAEGITDVEIIINAKTAEPISLGPTATSYKASGIPMGEESLYTVKVCYDDKYVSQGVTTTCYLPEFESKMGYVMTAPTIADLPDDDERAAATWFSKQPNAELIQAADLAALDFDLYGVLWVEIDRVGLPMGWENLPTEISSTATIDALKAFSAEGGSLYLANFATQLTVPLGIVPDNMAPTVFGSGEGGVGNDVWVINPYLGVDFKDGGDQGYYDRTAHAIYKGLTFEDPNGYGYLNLPLIGPGHREDHNCLWDCNIYGKGGEADVIRNFEVTTNSLVLATWGHVRDHCVAGLVEFYPTVAHGRCIANGFAAYEWNQNSGENPYQHNVEQLTTNILNYLK